MFFELKLALKYSRARRRSLARFTAAVAVIGIAAGVASLILAQALARGFADEMRDKILANTAHISVFMDDGTSVANWKDVIRELETTDNIKGILPTAYENAVLSGSVGTAYAVLKVSTRTGASAQLPPQVSIGAELARKTGLRAGDKAQIILVDEDRIPKTSEIFVRETFSTGLFDYDSVWVEIPANEFETLKGEAEFTPTMLNLSVTDIYETDVTAEILRRRLGETYKVLDWQEANKPLFAALSLERKAALLIISLIIFIAALNITTTLALLVNERRLDIAVLRTCGARMRSLVAIFFIEGFLLGAIGIFAGVVIGLAGCVAGSYFRVVRLSAEVYSLSYVPFHPRPDSVLLIVFTAFLLSAAATVYPAFKASRIKPLENLRSQ